MKISNCDLTTSNNAVWDYLRQPVASESHFSASWTSPQKVVVLLTQRRSSEVLMRRCPLVCDVEAHSKTTNARLAATSENSETTARRMHSLLGDIPHAPEPPVSADEAFARTAERGIQAEAMGVPMGQITADWNSPVVREALLQKGVGRRARHLLVQVQGAAAERRDANIHLLRRITDVARRSHRAHSAEITDLHLADLRRQAEEHHRDRKPAPFPGDDSSGDRGALCQEYGSAPRACTSHETSTPNLNMLPRRRYT